jgi:hypothetical protein
MDVEFKTWGFCIDAWQQWSALVAYKGWLPLPLDLLLVQFNFQPQVRQVSLTIGLLGLRVSFYAWRMPVLPDTSETR